MLKLVCKNCKKAWYTSEGVSRDVKSDCCGEVFEWEELLSDNEKENRIKQEFPKSKNNIGVMRV